jgi:hypothetical protein
MENRQGRLERKPSDESTIRKLSTGIKDRVKLYEDQLEECK